MGLDMYLNGNAYFYRLTDEELKTHPKEHIFRLGYWRKHPDLHGYIVQHFAKGEDNCRPIELSVCNLYEIIAAIEMDRLPHTTGFFFGESSNDTGEKAEAIAIIRDAIEWVRTDDGKTWRSIYYQASW